MTLFTECFEKNRVAARKHVYHAGDVIFSEGDNANGMYFIESGVVRISRKIPLTGGEVNLSMLEQEEFFGIVSFLTGRARMADARAVTESCLWLMDRKTFQEAVTKSPEFARLVIRGVLKRLEDLHIKMKDSSKQMAEFTQRLEGLFALWHSMITWG